MTPFEAHILIQQDSLSNSLSSTKTTNALEEALKAQRLNPNGAFKKESFLCTAIKRNSPNHVRLLLEYGASANMKSYENGRYEPAISTAVRYKSLACVRILVEYGANVNTTNFYGSDAIFQAVYENAFHILDYLLVEHYPKENGSDRRRQMKYEPPPPPKPIVIQKVTATKDGETCSSKGAPPRLVNIKESSHYGEVLQDEDDHDHVFCPFYYALNNATTYPCKEKSLVKLLQNYYKCKCVREIASCCSGPSEELDEDKAAVLECLGGLDSFLVFKRKSGTARELMSMDRNWLQMEQEQEQHDHYRPNVIFPGDDDNNENYIKLEDGGNEEKLCIYKIYRIEGKCHAIKENECVSSSSRAPPSTYLTLMGPLNLSCMAREVIRNQIMLCCTLNKNYHSSISSVASSPLPPVPPNNYDAGKRKFDLKWERRNLQKCLETLTLPASLTDYILYRNVEGCTSGGSMQRGMNNVKLIKKDFMLNVNYFAFSIL